MARPASDEELAAGAHAGDESAFSELHRRWVGRLYGFFTVRLPAGASADADVLAADTLSEAWLSLRNTVPGHFPSWIWTIARRRLATYLAARREGSEKAAMSGRPEEAAMSGRPEDAADAGGTVPATTPPAAEPGTARAGRSGTGKGAGPVTVAVDAIADPCDPVAGLAFREAELGADWPQFAALLRDSVDSLPQPYQRVLRASLEEFLASQPPATWEPLRGKDLAARLDITGREADRWRSGGLRRLSGAFVVTAMARRYKGAWPCERFRELCGEPPKGPLGETLCRSLVKHQAQCAPCTDARKRLLTTMELLPAFVPVLIPARLLLHGHPPAWQEQAPDTSTHHPAGQAAPPQPGGSGRPAAGRTGRKRGTRAGHAPRALAVSRPARALVAVTLLASVILLAVADASGSVITARPRIQQVTAIIPPPVDPRPTNRPSPANQGHPVSRGPSLADKVASFPPPQATPTAPVGQATTTPACGTPPLCIPVTSGPSASSPPTAALTATQVGNVTVQADASGSTSGSSPISTYNIDWGDGSSTGDQASPAATHDYGADGSYTVTVTVTDTDGLNSKNTAQVTVGPRTGRIVHTADGSCLDYQYSSGAGEDEVILNQCNGAASQEWTIMPDGEVQATPGQCLTYMRSDLTTIPFSVTTCGANGSSSVYIVQNFDFSNGSAPGQGAISAPDGAGGVGCMGLDPDSTVDLLFSCDNSADQVWSYPVYGASGG